MLFDCRPKILHKHCLQFLLGVKMAPRETENNAYAKFWGDKQRTLWYVMIFLEWSIKVCYSIKRQGLLLLTSRSTDEFKQDELLSSYWKKSGDFRPQELQDKTDRALNFIWAMEGPLFSFSISIYCWAAILPMECFCI